MDTRGFRRAPVTDLRGAARAELLPRSFDDRFGYWAYADDHAVPFGLAPTEPAMMQRTNPLSRGLGLYDIDQAAQEEQHKAQMRWIMDTILNNQGRDFTIEPSFVEEVLQRR